MIDKIEKVSEAWILEQMQAHGIKRKNFTNDLGLDRSYLSLLFADENNPRKIHLSKPMKAMFYLYFENLELKKANN